MQGQEVLVKNNNYSVVVVSISKMDCYTCRYYYYYINIIIKELFIKLPKLSGFLFYKLSPTISATNNSVSRCMYAFII